MATLTIDGKQATVPDGTLVIDAAAAVGIEIPRFCYHPRLKPAGACRVCLVEIEGTPKLQTSCTVPVRNDMVVRTDTEQVTKAREMVIEFILLHHPLDCPVCDKGGECDLQDITFRHGTGVQRFRGDRLHFRKAFRIGGSIVLDQERCIECFRCVRFLEEWPNELAFAFHQRADHSVIRAFDDRALGDTRFCGNTIDLCPVGALTSEKFRFRARPWELENADAVCPHCSVGCNIVAGGRLGVYCRTTPRANMQINDQWICDRGRYDHDGVNEDRILRPAIVESGDRRDVSWEDMATALSGRLGDDPNRGASAMLVDSSTSCEDGYAAAKVARCGLRTNAIYQSDPAASLPRLEARIDEIVGREVVLILGPDLWTTHPVLWLRLARARSERGLRIHAVGAMGSETGRRADVGMAAGPAGLYAVVAWMGGQLALEQAAEIAGVAPKQLAETEAWLKRTAQPAILVGSDGAGDGRLLARGVQGLRARAAGPIAVLPNGSNTWGLVRVGVDRSMAPGLTPVQDNTTKKTIKKAWDAALPADAAPATLREALSGRGRRCLYIVGGDPMADGGADFAAMIESVDTVIYQGTNWNATARRADLVLPAAAFCEVEHSRVSLEGRLQLSNACLPPRGEALPGWRIAALVGSRLGGRYRDELAAVRREMAECHASLRAFVALSSGEKESFLTP